MLRHIPDVVIAAGVIVGAGSISMGFRVIGVVAFGIAMLVGWKRDWAMDLLDETFGSSEGSSVNQMHEPHAEEPSDAGHRAEGDLGH